MPFEKWLDDLDDKRAIARVLARVARVRQGNVGDCKSVGEGVCELRVDYGPGYRVYFGQSGRTLVVLLCGGDKRTQDRDIRRPSNIGVNLNKAIYEKCKLQEDSK